MSFYIAFHAKNATAARRVLRMQEHSHVPQPIHDLLHAGLESIEKVFPDHPVIVDVAGHFPHAGDQYPSVSISKFDLRPVAYAEAPEE